MKNKETKNFALRMVSVFVAVAFLAPLSAFASPGYTMGAVTAQVTGAYKLSVSGSASANPYVGTDTQQFVTIDWGETVGGVPQRTTMNVKTDARFTTTFASSPKRFNTSWTPISHTYSSTGNKTILVKVHHSGFNGNEGDASEFSVNVFIPPAVLNVIKHVVNTGGGTKVASDFTLSVMGGGALIASFAGSESGTLVSLSAGSYTVDEVNSFGYGVSYSPDCTGTIAAEQSKTCTVTNTFNAVPDTTPPVVTITPPTQTVEATGPSGAPANFVVTAFDDVDGDLSGLVSCNYNSGDTFPIGTTTIACSTTDSADNTGSATASVTVADTTPPVITLNGSATMNLTVGDSFSDLGATATDLVDGPVPVTVGGDTVDTNTPGTYTITYDAVDSAGNHATQVTRTVTVSDVDAPVVTITPASQTIEATGSSGAIASFTVTAIDATDGDLSGSVTCDQVSGATFPLGVTTVNCQATDGSGNTGYGAATITIVDTTGPIITLNGSATMNLTVGGSFSDPGATATDLVDGPVPVTVGGDTVDTNTPGTYTITYDAVDSAGNHATQVMRTVVVSAITPPADTTPPVITLLGDPTVNLTVGGSFSDPGATANDNVDGDITGNIVVVNPVDTATPGTYTITYNVSDAAGNAATQVTRTVIVSNPTPPGGGGGGGGNGGGGGVILTGGGGGGGSIPQVAGASIASGEVLGEATCSVEYLRDYLGMGKKNDPEQVTLLQDFLNRNLGLTLPKSGIFGQLTKSAVEQFQVKYNGEVLKPWVPYGLPNDMTPTGYVYKTTKRWINMLECPDLNLVMPELP